MLGCITLDADAEAAVLGVRNGEIDAERAVVAGVYWRPAEVLDGSRYRVDERVASDLGPRPCALAAAAPEPNGAPGSIRRWRSRSRSGLGRMG